MEDTEQKFWTMPGNDVMQLLRTSSNGLTNEEAKKRIGIYGLNTIKARKSNSVVKLLISQFKSPIILLLFSAIGLSFYLKDTADAFIILTIVLASGLLGFWQEYSAGSAVEKLLALVQIKATLLRDGKQEEIEIEEIVPGDVIILKAGDIIPGDCVILDSDSLFVDESTLTGETFPIEKEAGVLPADTALGHRRNSLWMGTHVISGTGNAVVISTGKDTEFGKISERLKLRPSETEFEQGVKKFGYFLMEITLILVMLIFAINVFLKRPAIDSFLFSLALAVGLTPQLLPAIISINLAHGAKIMAESKVIVKRLASIENFGSMNILCSDKTGTLTDGVVKLQSTPDIEGNHSEKVLLYAYLNAIFESGFVNPIDAAIRSFKKFDISGYVKLDEEPYDFIRKRLSILLTEPDKDSPDGKRRIVVTKGALKNILSVCTRAEIGSGKIVDLLTVKDKVQKQYEEYSSKGYRTLGIAYKTRIESLHKGEQESDMIFLGFIILFDPLKPGIIETINELETLGVSLKIITGDNKLIAENVVRQLGKTGGQIITGPELNETSDSALLKRVSEVTVFAEVEPNQKERIVNTFKKAGYVTGYMGDGINDASALHAADVSISVDSGADVAKEAADIVLLEKNLSVLIEGVKAGRITFANTLKYVFMATSANFGNMFSMAGASLFLPFIPLLPKQILLTNLLTDFPEMAIASDNVDQELVMQPRRWNIKFIRKFMMTFGLISSIFDYLTFGILVFALKATDIQFRTGWFIESVVSAALIVLVIRTGKPFFKSVPGRYLMLATLLILAFTITLPYTPFAGILGLKPLPAWVLLIILAIVALYIVTAEAAKKLFYKIVRN
ncbi:MAG TPA: magnesium-translocating P-type ATPase [Clostridia bacterium]|nr:magnesium-translocating P-type ATPase [Clostridia bacterium]